MPIQVTRFKCAHCSRLFVHERNAKWHEDNRCLYNPVRRACLSCKHFHGADVRIDEFRRDNAQVCTALNEYFDERCSDWMARDQAYVFWLPPDATNFHILSKYREAVVW